MPPNGLELSCPAEAGRLPMIVAHPGGRGAPPYPLARRVSFSELLGAESSLHGLPLDETADVDGACSDRKKKPANGQEPER